MPHARKPTHAAVGRFIASIIPLKENDVPHLYHVPRHSQYNPEFAIVDQIVLSVTPTAGVYALIGHPDNQRTMDADRAAAISPYRPPRTICFLHRPFDLNRRTLRKGTLVVSSHTSFDEVLTVGCNPHLAERLGMNTQTSVCIEGYAGKAGWDPDRKIGIVGQVSQQREIFIRRIEEEFGPAELVQNGSSANISVVGIMNAFNEEQMIRVLEASRQEGWIPPEGDGRNLLYLTGQPRMKGLEAAQAYGVTVVCVGHRAAEEWGIGYIANQLRVTYPDLHIEEIYEEEQSVARENMPSARSAA